MSAQFNFLTIQIHPKKIINKWWPSLGYGHRCSLERIVFCGQKVQSDKTKNMTKVKRIIIVFTLIVEIGYKRGNESCQKIRFLVKF